MKKRIKKKNLGLILLAREISQSPARFLSIFVISLIAVAFFAGFRATSPDMKLTADRYFDSTRTADLSMLSTDGFSVNDIKLIRDTPGIKSVMPIISQDVLLAYDEDDEANIKLLSLPIKASADVWSLKPASLTLGRYDLDKDGLWLGKPEVLKGRLPENLGEIALDAYFAELHDVVVGTRVVCSTSSGNKDMVISGIVTSPYYIGLERGNSRVGSGTSQGFAYAMGNDIADLSTRLPLASLLTVRYTQLWVEVDGAAAYDSFSGAYLSFVDRTRPKSREA